jgi:hypothetical protein
LVQKCCSDNLNEIRYFNFQLFEDELLELFELVEIIYNGGIYSSNISTISGLPALTLVFLPQSPRQCFTMRLMICASSGDLVGTELGNFVLGHSDDLDLEGPRVVGKSGLGV